VLVGPRLPSTERVTFLKIIKERSLASTSASNRTEPQCGCCNSGWNASHPRARESIATESALKSNLPTGIGIIRGER